MQTINNRMTETQIADLFSLAVQLQVKAEESDDRDTAILAYSIQNACSNLTESQREFRSADITMQNLEAKCAALAAENAYLLNGAARELNTSWMFHKTMLGAQAALVCLSHGYQAATREWLEGTTDEAGAEIPDDISVGELPEWFDSQMVSNNGKSGFLTRAEAEEAIRKACPATDAFLAEVLASAIPADVMAAIQKVARIRLDLNDFDGDKRGIIDCLSEAEESLIEVVNKFAAQLRKGAAL
ncbi:TPA: hypothetical protein ACTV4G_003931 [Citrobacter freundii]